MLEGALDPEIYIVGPGDKIGVQLFGLQPTSMEAEVGVEGALVLPRVGAVQVSGLTLVQARARIAEWLKKTYPRLGSSVSLLEPRRFVVHVTGAVARPGTYAATPLTRASTLLPIAGGVLPAGSSRVVELRHRGPPAHTQVVDLLRFLLLGEPDGDPYLLDGDTLFVPPRALTVEIDGAVRRPGRYELVKTRDVAELLALAGGLAPEAARGLPWRLTSRGTGDAMGVRSVAANAKLDLHDGDLVRVPAVDDLRRTVIVEGAVIGPPGVGDAQRAPGIVDLRADATQNMPRDISVTLPFIEGDGLRDLINKARGLQPWADARGAYLMRVNGEGARKRIGVDLVAVLNNRSAEVPVEAGDTLIVPSRNESVMVGGAVQRPGMYQYRPDLKPTDYLALAGGATRNGSPRDARLLARIGGSVSLERASAVEPGDIITVPERKFTTADWVTITLVLSNLAVGVTALALTATR